MSQFENSPRRPIGRAEKAKIQLVVIVYAERRKPGQIAVVRRQRAKLGHRGRLALRKLHRPDAAGAVVAEEVFARQRGGVFPPAIDEPADDTAIAVSAAIFEEGGLRLAEQGGRRWFSR